jgi:hypothetical protein
LSIGKYSGYFKRTFESGEKIGKIDCPRAKAEISKANYFLFH